GTAFVLAANTLLRPIVNAINRQPLDVDSVEVTNIVHVIVGKQRQRQLMAALEAELERHAYPVTDLQVNAFGEDDVEIEAVLTATSVEAAKMDAVVRRLQCLPAVRQTFWSPSTSE